MSGLTSAQQEGLSATERAIREKGLTAPRVTPADLEAAIFDVRYLNAGEAVCAVGSDPTIALAHGHPLTLLTLCILELHNGFTVVGKSACASPENYDRELGQRIALNDAKRQLWPLLGYALRQRLHDEGRS